MRGYTTPRGMGSSFGSRWGEKGKVAILGTLGPPLQDSRQHRPEGRLGVVSRLFAQKTGTGTRLEKSHIYAKRVYAHLSPFFCKFISGTMPTRRPRAIAVTTRLGTKLKTVAEDITGNTSRPEKDQRNV